MGRTALLFILGPENVARLPIFKNVLKKGSVIVSVEK